MGGSDFARPATWTLGECVRMPGALFVELTWLPFVILLTRRTTLAPDSFRTYTTGQVTPELGRGLWAHGTGTTPVPCPIACLGAATVLHGLPRSSRLHVQYE